MTIPGTLHKAN